MVTREIEFVPVAICVRDQIQVESCQKVLMSSENPLHRLSLAGQVSGSLAEKESVSTSGMERLILRPAAKVFLFLQFQLESSPNPSLCPTSCRGLSVTKTRLLTPESKDCDLGSPNSNTSGAAGPPSAGSQLAWCSIFCTEAGRARTILLRHTQIRLGGGCESTH